MNHVVILLLFLAVESISQEAYFPGLTHTWAHRSPTDMGLSADSIDAAIAYAQAHESTNPRNLQLAHYIGFGREPFGDGIGPHKTRGDQTGIILKDGYIIAEWGMPHRVDMTFSVSKSFLSATIGVAYDQGLIRDVAR